MNNKSTPSTYRTNELLTELITTMQNDRFDEWQLGDDSSCCHVEYVPDNPIKLAV